MSDQRDPEKMSFVSLLFDWREGIRTKNIAVNYGAAEATTTSSTAHRFGGTSRIFQLLAGETCAAAVYSGTASTLSTAAEENFITIDRVGNY